MRLRRDFSVGWPLPLVITIDELQSGNIDELREFGAVLQHVTRREQYPIAFAGASLPSIDDTLLIYTGGDRSESRAAGGRRAHRRSPTVIAQPVQVWRDLHSEQRGPAFAAQPWDEIEAEMTDVAAQWGVLCHPEGNVRCRKAVMLLGQPSTNRVVRSSRRPVNTLRRVSTLSLGPLRSHVRSTSRHSVSSVMPRTSTWPDGSLR